MDDGELEYQPIAPKATLHFVAMTPERHQALTIRLAMMEAALRTIRDKSENDTAGFRRNTLKSIHRVARSALAGEV